MQITSLDYSSFLGRIAIGKVARGTHQRRTTHFLMQDRRWGKKSKGCKRAVRI
jgi:GTP-binding protein